MMPDQADLAPQRRARRSSAESDSAEDTKAKRPKTPSIQAPMDIGSQNLKAPIMFRKRLGVPRSRMSRMPAHARSAAATGCSRCATTPRSRALPKLSAMAAVK